MALLELVEKLDLLPETRSEVLSLVKRKKAGDELGLTERSHVLDQFIETQFEQMKPFAKKPPQTGVVDYARLDQLFREAIERHALKLREGLL
jgi:hypothetical protein